MITHRIFPIEILEARIAPAGLIAVDYDDATGALTLTGDGASNYANVFQTGLNTYRIESESTDLGMLGTHVLDIGKLTSLTIDAGAGSDGFELTNLRALTAFSFSGGANNDAFLARNMTVVGSVEIHADTGADSVAFSGISTRITGHLTLDSGSGIGDSISISLEAQKTVIGGSVAYTGGGDQGIFSTAGTGTVTIGKGVNFNAGSDGGTLRFGNAGLVSIGKFLGSESIIFNGGDGADNLNFSGRGATLAGGIRMLGAEGADRIELGAESGSIKVGKLAGGPSIYLDGGPGGDVIQSNVAVLTLAGGIGFTGGDGVNRIELTSPGGTIKIGNTKVGASVAFSGGADENSLVTETANLILAGGIDFSEGTGDHRIEIRGENGKGTIGRLSDGASIRLRGLGGEESIFASMANLTLLGGIDLFGKEGESSLEFSDETGSARIGKTSRGNSIHFEGGADKDTIEMNLARLTLDGGIEFFGEGGDNTVNIDSDGFVKIGRIKIGDSLVLFGATDSVNEVHIGGAATLLGGVALIGGAGTDRIDLHGSVSVGQNSGEAAVALFGEAGEDSINFEGNITLGGALEFYGGEGDDELNLTNLETLGINGRLNFIGDAGDDRFDLRSETLSIIGTTIFQGGDDTDLASLVADGILLGDVTLDLGSANGGSQAITVTSLNLLPAGLALKGALTLNSTNAATFADQLTMTNVSVSKLVHLGMGEGVSLVTIDNLRSSGDLVLDSRGGADVVNIERGDFFGGSLIKGVATILLGLGDDTLVIGSPLGTFIPPFPDNNRVNFVFGLGVDAGSGANDKRNDIVGENDGIVSAALIGFEFTSLI